MEGSSKYTAKPAAADEAWAEKPRRAHAAFDNRQPPAARLELAKPDYMDAVPPVNTAANHQRKVRSPQIDILFL